MKGLMTVGTTCHFSGNVSFPIGLSLADHLRTAVQLYGDGHGYRNARSSRTSVSVGDIIIHANGSANTGVWARANRVAHGFAPIPWDWRYAEAIDAEWLRLCLGDHHHPLDTGAFWTRARMVQNGFVPFEAYAAPSDAVCVSDLLP